MITLKVSVGLGLFAARPPPMLFWYWPRIFTHIRSFVSIGLALELQNSGGGNITLIPGANVVLNNGQFVGNGGGLTNLPPSTNMLNLHAQGGVNVKAFGAKGDGVTDDTASISNAIIFAVTNATGLTSSNVVYAPATIAGYLVSPIQITNSGMVFYGDGLNASRFMLKSNGNSIAMFTVSAPDVVISDIWCDGNTNLAYTSFRVNNQSFGIKAKAQGISRVMNCRITTFSDGLFVDGTNNIGTADTFDNGFYGFNVISNCWFLMHCAPSNNCEYVKIEGNTMMSGGYGFLNESAANILFVGNKVVNNTHGIGIEPAASGSNPKRAHSIYTGNIINHNSSDSVECVNAQDAAFVGNEVMGAGTINLSGATNFFFSANHFQFNSANAFTFTAGLWNRAANNNLSTGSGDTLSGVTTNNFFAENNREAGVGVVWEQPVQGANYQSTYSDRLVLLTATTTTNFLPNPTVARGFTQTTKLTVTGTAAITVQNGEKIDGATSYALSAQWKYVTVRSDGTNWQIIANN